MMALMINICEETVGWAMDQGGHLHDVMGVALEDLRALPVLHTQQRAQCMSRWPLCPQRTAVPMPA